MKIVLLILQIYHGQCHRFYHMKQHLAGYAKTLAKLVNHCGLFDSYTLTAFANTREANGTYHIVPGDPLLISTVKCIINIFIVLK